MPKNIFKCRLNEFKQALLGFAKVYRQPFFARCEINVDGNQMYERCNSNPFVLAERWLEGQKDFLCRNPPKKAKDIEVECIIEMDDKQTIAAIMTPVPLKPPHKREPDDRQARREHVIRDTLIQLHAQLEAREEEVKAKFIGCPDYTILENAICGTPFKYFMYYKNGIILRSPSDEWAYLSTRSLSPKVPKLSFDTEHGLVSSPGYQCEELEEACREWKNNDYENYVTDYIDLPEMFKRYSPSARRKKRSEPRLTKRKVEDEDEDNHDHDDAHDEDSEQIRQVKVKVKSTQDQRSKAEKKKAKKDKKKRQKNLDQAVAIAVTAVTASSSLPASANNLTPAKEDSKSETVRKTSLGKEGYGADHDADNDDDDDDDDQTQSQSRKNTDENLEPKSYKKTKKNKNDETRTAVQ